MPTPFWYLTRSAGVVATLLLTTSVVLGIVDFSRWSSQGWPRFLTDTLHRNVSMLALVMVVLHVITTVADGFAPIGFQDAIIPFLSPYRPLWLGLGALSFDLLLAVTVTSLLRKRIGYRTWRAVHWSAYACWPLAMFHGLGTGTDASSTWMLLLSALCLAAVVVRDRLARPRGDAAGRGAHPCGQRARDRPYRADRVLRRRTARIQLGRPGRHAVEPPALRRVDRGRRVHAQSPSLTAPFNARLSGSLKQQASAGSGLTSVEMRMDMSHGASGTLDVTITGQPLRGVASP